MRTITFLNQSGDITIEWDEARDDQMRAVIRKKMDEGVTFFIVKEIDNREWVSKIRDINEISDSKVRIYDADLEKMFSENSNGLRVTRHEIAEIDTVKKAETPDEVVQNNSVAVRPLRGG